MSTLVLGLHVLLAALIVGPQFLLFFAVVPSTWLIEDERLRRAVTRVVTQRFGLMTGAALIGLLLTGLYQLSSPLVDSDVRTHMMEYRFGIIFAWKMLFIIVLIALIAVHGAIFGKRVRLASEALERREGDVGDLEAARRNSLLFSMSILFVSVVILFLGVALGNHMYSFEPR